MKKRDLFAELMEGMEALEADRKGKLTLKKSKVEYKAAPVVTAADVVRVRMSLNVSQQVFARKIRTEAKTLANWEQGRSKPNAQAALLIKLVEKYPETVALLAMI